MTRRRIIRPPDQHHHDLPSAYAEPAGTLVECPGCNRWFVRGETYVGFGYDQIWCRVSWFNFILRRKIAREVRP